MHYIVLAVLLHVFTLLCAEGIKKDIQPVFWLMKPRDKSIWKFSCGEGYQHNFYHLESSR